MIGGGHGPGRNTPGKTGFPSRWSDDQTMDAITDVANDPAGTRTLVGQGWTVVEGTRDGIDLRVVVAPDRRSIHGAYPVNVPRTPVPGGDSPAPYDPAHVHATLLRLHEASLSLPDYPARHMREAIEAGEDGLALDWIAHAWSGAEVPMPAPLFATARLLALHMEIAEHPGYAALAPFLLRLSRPAS